MRKFFEFMSTISWTFGKNNIMYARFSVGGGQFYAKLWKNEFGGWDFTSKPIAISKSGKRVRKMLTHAMPVEGRRDEAGQARFAAVKCCFEMLAIRPETFAGK